MPSPASPRTPDDFLLSRNQFVLSYNRSRGIPNWVAWHLDEGDLGSAGRAQFAPDPRLPKSWRRVMPDDYRGLGVERGHMCPAGDRTSSRADVEATFLMTNVVPQSSDNNQGPWLHLEEYCRVLARDGSELYVVAGGAPPFVRCGSGKVWRPGMLWKVIVVLDSGARDLRRIDGDTRIIAVLIPNRDGLRGARWRDYRTSAGAIERLTGLRFFTKLAPPVRRALLSKVDR